MDSDIMSALESVSSVLTDRGFDKEAATVSEAAAYMRPHPPVSRPPAPTPMGTVWDKSQDTYTELDPTGKGQHKSVKPLAEIQKNIGIMTPEEIEYELHSNTDPAVRKYLHDFVSVIKQVQLDKIASIVKLASLGEALTEKGYDTLGRRLFEAAGRLSAQVKSSPDKHATPSIEAVFEASKSAKDFEDGVKKLGQMYEDISKLVKEIDKEYLDKIMHPLDRKEITEEEAKSRTIEMIRGTDLKIDNRFKTIS